MNYKGYLIDLDGTMYNGEAVIDGAKDFINALNCHQIPYLFLTNNATKSQVEAASKLLNMGFDVTADHMYTSSMATAEYLQHYHMGERAFVVGTHSLKNLVADAGLTLVENEADVVVMGLDMNVTYAVLGQAALEVGSGAQFIATNLDKSLPVENGFIPGNGSIVQVVINTTGKQPIVIGKPEHHILDCATRVLGLDKSSIAMVGDNYDTDIMTGINGNIDTIHVNTGVTSYAEILTKEVKPTHMINNLKEWSVTS